MDPLVIPIVALMIPITAIWTHHLRKMAEIKAQQGQTVAPDVRRDLNEIRQQIAELRDTTTRFDMSLDAAMTRVEQRVDSLESNEAAPMTHRVSVSNPSDTETVILQGRGR